MSSRELDAFVYVLGLAGGKLGQNWTFGSRRKPHEGTVRVQSADKSIASLESIGVKIYGVDEARVSSSKKKNTTFFNFLIFFLEINTHVQRRGKNKHKSTPNKMVQNAT